MEIVKIPSLILKKQLNNVPLKDIGSGKHAPLTDNMRQTMTEAKGIGLAANQVGQDLMLFVIDKKLAKENAVPDVFFNPEVTNYSRDKDEMEEGCVSIPGFYHHIRRSKKIKIKAVDEHGRKVKFKAKGLLARVLQHETDHLNGYTVKDRVSD